MKYAVVTAARNEALYFRQTIASLTSQTLLPVRWVIVDDGSTDETTRLALDAAANHPWIRVICRPDRGYRMVGEGNYDALQEGFRMLADEDFDFLCVVDGDVYFRPSYFVDLLARFAANPRLGIGGGAVIDLLNGRLYRADLLPEMTGGPLKCYRRACFAQIGGLVRAASWDAIDCYKAMMIGWQSQTFDEPELQIMHLRPTGSSQQGFYDGRLRRGAGMYFMGSHPVWVFSSALRRLFEPPVVLGSLCVIAGYFREMLRGATRINDPELITFIRAWQMRKLVKLLFLR
jgi:glycosyltransferase involved in cell wall biosynthesis